MDYEKKIREYLNSDEVDQLYKSMLVNLFPELKESEDDKIRKNCIHFLELQKEHYACTLEIDECIDWLEKQGEQKSAEWSEKDKEMLERCIGAIGDADYYTLNEKREMEQWIRSILNRIKPAKS